MSERTVNHVDKSAEVGKKEDQVDSKEYKSIRTLPIVSYGLIPWALLTKHGSHSIY